MPHFTAKPCNPLKFSLPILLRWIERWIFVKKNGAILIKEADLEVDFENKFSQLVNSKEKQQKLGENIKKLALVNATKDIADEVEKLLKK